MSPTIRMSFLVFINCTIFGFVTNCYSKQENSTIVLRYADVLRHTEQVLKILDQHYVYPHVAANMRKKIENNIDQGSYKNIVSSKALIKKLQIDLRKNSKDEHISLHLAHESKDRASHIGPSSAALEKVEFSALSDKPNSKNISYLRFNKFTNKVKKELTDAMAQLEQHSPLIIDLRDNGGGDPNTVTFLASYFLEGGTPLWSILDRNGDTVFSASSHQAKRRQLGLLCILISNKTYSAAEAFAYTLKHLDRACVVGEPSRGGAHLVEMQKVNEQIDIRIPVARAYNQITKTNWEGVGVIPTIKTSAGDAKQAAVDFLLNASEPNQHIDD